MKFELEGRSTMNSKNVPNPPVNINHLWENYTATFEKKFGFVLGIGRQKVYGLCNRICMVLRDVLQFWFSQI